MVTGSSAIELSNSINEPLTGRKYEYVMYPFSAEELINEFGAQDERRMLERRLVYGSYPEVVNNAGEEREVLTDLVGSYLYKDIFLFQDVRTTARSALIPRHGILSTVRNIPLKRRIS